MHAFNSIIYHTLKGLVLFTLPLPLLSFYPIGLSDCLYVRITYKQSVYDSIQFLTVHFFYISLRWACSISPLYRLPVKCLPPSAFPFILNDEWSAHLTDASLTFASCMWHSILFDAQLLDEAWRWCEFMDYDLRVLHNSLVSGLYAQFLMWVNIPRQYSSM